MVESFLFLRHSTINSPSLEDSLEDGYLPGAHILVPKPQAKISSFISRSSPSFSGSQKQDPEKLDEEVKSLVTARRFFKN